MATQNHNLGIYDHSTGQEIIRELTQEEIAQRDAEIAVNLAIKAEIAAKRTAAEAKLAALGLTADDLKALGLG